MRMNEQQLKILAENAKDLKDSITQDQLYLLYWYIAEHGDELGSEQLSQLYDVLSVLDDKFLEDDE